MNRIDRLFRDYRANGRKVLIGFLTAGYPDKKSFQRAVPVLCRAGLDLLEIGVPFSDPIADGPTIQAASQKALRQRVTLAWILQNVSRWRRAIDRPMVLMSYLNPLEAMGLDRFVRRAVRSGVDGVIVPDLIPEEGRRLEKAAARVGLHLIYLAAPTTARARLPRIARSTRGFLYAVSVTGVTGARQSLPNDLGAFLRRVRRSTSKPVALGFGVSSPKQVRRLRGAVDGVIVGSAILRLLARARRDGFAPAARLVASLQKALNPGLRVGGSHAS